MKNCILSIFVAFVLSLVLMAPAAAAEVTYTDVPQGHWATENIVRATQLGIFQGVSENTFGFGQPISRAAFAQALVRLFHWETVSPQTATFADVSSTAWYYAAVETAVENGAIPVSGRSFRPTQTLTRSEMVSMLIRALGYGSLAGTVSSVQSPFADVTANRGFITMAYDMGIVNGVGNGCFAPDAAATRDQAAALLVRVYDRLTMKNEKVEATSQAAIIVETPTAEQDSELPTTPLEPIGALYAALRYQKQCGQDMSQLALCLTAGGVRTVSSKEGTILATDFITAEQVQEILAGSDVRAYYSERYESAYCVYEPNEYQTATLWYQSEESIAVKLQLARMFGVTRYILQ